METTEEQRAHNRWAFLRSQSLVQNDVLELPDEGLEFLILLRMENGIAHAHTLIEAQKACAGNPDDFNFMPATVQEIRDETGTYWDFALQLPEDQELRIPFRAIKALDAMEQILIWAERNLVGGGQYVVNRAS